MIILFFFAFISGFVTIFAPCIWPILPIVLSSSTGGHRKPLGITLGIMLSFALLTLFLSYFVKLIPFDTNYLRIFAAIIIALLGLTLIIPKFSIILEGFVSRFAGRFGSSNQTSKTGFFSGFITGLSLGVVWTPCAGPILATIATLAATQSVNLATVLVTFFYVIGVGIPLFIFSEFGNRIFGKSKLLSKYTITLQRVFGIIILLTALLILTGYDTVLETKLLKYFPSYSNALNSFESNTAVKKQLNSLKNTSALNKSQDFNNSPFNTDYQAPDFVGITKWLNTNKPLSIKDLKGKVVLVDFWTYTCINCIRTLPHVTSWYQKYKDKGFVVIGVHTPEFQFEHETDNIENAIKMYNIHYPVAQDNNYATWTNYNNEYWPAEYLIDVNGNVRRTHFGEGKYDQTEMAIQQLLKQSGENVSQKLDNMPDQTPKVQLSPETYLGSKRMQYYYPSLALSNGEQNFTLSDNLNINSFSFGGNWNITNETAIAGKTAVLNYNFIAGKVYIILRPGAAAKTGGGKVKVYLDGRVIDNSVSGADDNNGIITVNSDRLYSLVDLHGKVGQHVIKLQFETPGIEAYTFTFGQ